MSPDRTDWTWFAVLERCRAEADRRELPTEYAAAAAELVDAMLDGIALAGVEPAAVADRVDLIAAAMEAVRAGLVSGELDDGAAYVAFRAAQRSAA